MRKTVLVPLVFLGATQLAQADYTADIFAMDSNRQTKLFTVKSETQESDLTQSKATFFYASGEKSGEVALIETVWMKGSELKKMELEQKQTGQSAAIEVTDSHVIFRKKDKDKEREEKEKKPENLVISGSLSRFIKQNIEAIKKGDKVKFRFASWERMETVGFEVFKMGEEMREGAKVLKLKMKASSFIIAAIVDPLTFIFSEDGSKLLEHRGRVAPKKNVNGSWKDLDAEAVYTHF